MTLYLISYAVSFTAARLGWFLPSGLALMLGGFCLYWKDYKARTYSTHRNLIEGMKNPRGSREGEARRFAERDFAIH